MRHAGVPRRKKLSEEIKQFPSMKRIMRNDKKHGGKETRKEDNPKS